MRWVLLLIVVICLFSLVSHAQDTSVYRRRTSSVAPNTTQWLFGSAGVVAIEVSNP